MDQFPVSSENTGNEIIAVDRMKLKVIHTQKQGPAEPEVWAALAEAFGESCLYRTDGSAGHLYRRGNKL